MGNSRDHIIFFIAQKLFHLERGGHIERYNRMISLFEQINLDGLLQYLSRYYEADVDRELDDIYMEEGELAFVTRRRPYRFKHVFRDGKMRLIGIEIDGNDAEPTVTTVGIALVVLQYLDDVLAEVVGAYLMVFAFIGSNG